MIVDGVMIVQSWQRQFKNGQTPTQQQPQQPLYRISYIESRKNAKIHRFFCIFPAFFLNIWPLAGPNIAKKGGPLQKLARVGRQTHFGTFNFWLEP